HGGALRLCGHLPPSPAGTGQCELRQTQAPKGVRGPPRLRPDRRGGGRPQGAGGAAHPPTGGRFTPAQPPEEALRREGPLGVALAQVVPRLREGGQAVMSRRILHLPPPRRAPGPAALARRPVTVRRCHSIAPAAYAPARCNRAAHSATSVTGPRTTG